LNCIAIPLSSDDFRQAAGPVAAFVWNTQIWTITRILKCFLTVKFIEGIPNHALDLAPQIALKNMF
jgi:hypothetical protein